MRFYCTSTGPITVTTMSTSKHVRTYVCMYICTFIGQVREVLKDCDFCVPDCKRWSSSLPLDPDLPND